VSYFKMPYPFSLQGTDKFAKTLGQYYLTPDRNFILRPTEFEKVATPFNHHVRFPLSNNSIHFSSELLKCWHNSHLDKYRDRTGR